MVEKNYFRTKLDLLPHWARRCEFQRISATCKVGLWGVATSLFAKRGDRAAPVLCVVGA